MSNVDTFMEEEEDVDMSDSEELLDEEDDMADEEETAAPEPTAEADAALARRRAIQDIMRDSTLSADERRFRIQALMSNNRVTVPAPAPPVVPVAETGNAAACVHYERNCNIVSPCCNRIFGCRICHDELANSTCPPLNRFLIREVVCKNCNIRQPAS